MRTEEWRVIEDNPNYQISNFGRVKSHPTQWRPTELILKLKKGVMGRGFYTLTKNKKGYNISPNTLLSIYWRYEFIHQLEEGEECIELKDHPNYFITSKGRLWSNLNQSFLTPHLSQKYPTYNISGTTSYIHRLLGEYFIPNPHNYPMVLHKEDNPLDYNLDNLRWGTQTHNSKDAFKNNKRTLKHYEFYTTSGDLVETTNLPSWCDTHNLSKDYVRTCIRRHRPVNMCNTTN